MNIRYVTVTSVLPTPKKIKTFLVLFVLCASCRDFCEGMQRRVLISPRGFLKHKKDWSTSAPLIISIFLIDLPLVTARPLRDVDRLQSEFAKDKTTGWVKLMTCSCLIVNLVQIQCWPWQILGLQNPVLEKVASTIWINGAAIPLALLPPPSFKTGSPLAEPVPSEFKLWREGVGYTAKYDINYLLRPTFDLKKNHRIVIYRSSSSGIHNSHLSQILSDAYPRF